MDFREKYEEMVSARLDSLMDIYKKSELSLEHLDNAKTNTSNVFGEIGSHIQVGVTSDDPDTEVEAYIADRDIRSMQSSIEEPVDGTLTEVRSVRDQTIAEMILMLKDDMKLEDPVLSPYEWCLYLKETNILSSDSIHGLLPRLLEKNPPNSAWGRSLLQSITPTTMWNAWANVWCSEPAVAKQWRTALLERPHNVTASSNRVFSELWADHAVQHAISPSATIDGQTHMQICEDFVALGAQPRWDSLPLQIFFVHINHNSIDDMIDVLQQRFERLFSLDPMSAKEKFGSITSANSNRSNTAAANQFASYDPYSSVTEKIRRLLVSLSTYNSVSFSDVDTIFQHADKYLTIAQEKNPEYKHSKSFASMFRQVCGDLEVHDMGGVSAERKRKM